MTVKNEFLNQLLMKQGTANLGIALDQQSERRRTSDKSQVRVTSSHIFEFKTSQGMRVFDGVKADESERGLFIPGFHHLDNSLHRHIKPAYLSGCPIARFHLLNIEMKLAILKTEVNAEHADLTEELTMFAKSQPSYSIETRGDEVIGVRNMSFSSPHVRDLMLEMGTIEKCYLICDLLASLIPTRRTEILKRKKAMSSLIRNLLDMQNRYRNTGATIKDFHENNQRAQQAIESNKGIKLPEDFAEWMKTNTQQSVYFDPAPTLEQYLAAEKAKSEEMEQQWRKESEEDDLSTLKSTSKKADVSTDHTVTTQSDDAEAAVSDGQ